MSDVGMLIMKGQLLLFSVRRDLFSFYLQLKWS